MEEKEKKLKAIFIKSSLTGKPYVSEENSAFIVDSVENAKKFTEIHNNTIASEIQIKSESEINFTFYSAGAEYVTYIKNGEQASSKLNTEEYEKWGKNDNPFFNNQLNRNIALLKHFGCIDYLMELKNSVFYMPARIDYKNNSYGTIHYAVARKKKDKSDFMYLAFSDRPSFTAWTAVQKENNWDLIKMEFSNLFSIASERGVIIDISTNHLVLNRELMKRIYNEK